jgi:predicted nucleic-acid-binding Zn-ribbon protein
MRVIIITGVKEARVFDIWHNHYPTVSCMPGNEKRTADKNLIK